MRHSVVVLAVVLFAAVSPAAATDQGMGVSTVNEGYGAVVTTGPAQSTANGTATASTVDRTVSAAANRTAPAVATMDGTAPAATAPPSSAAQIVDVSLTYRMDRRTDDSVLITLTVPSTEQLSDFSLFMQDGATVVSTDGFASEGDRSEWDGYTESPSLTYRLNLSVAGKSGRDGDTAVVSTPWAEPAMAASLEGGEFADESVSRSVEGEGLVASESVVVLGPYETAERTVDGQTLRVVVPGDQRLHHSKEHFSGALANASKVLDTPENEDVTGVVASSLGTLVAGTTIGDETFLARGNVSTVTWIHEYVHTQQETPEDDSMRWYSEGSAEYYGYQIAVRYGYADAGDFQHMLLQAHEDTSVLSKPDTWAVQSDYQKGSAAIALLDRKIREATDGEQTFRAVFDRLNRREEFLNVSMFLDAVRAVGGDDLAALARKHVTTDVLAPDGWQEGVYERTYGFEPARVEAEITDATAAGLAGERTLDPDAYPDRVLTNETVTLRFEAENTGGIAGYASYLTDVERRGSRHTRLTGSWTGWLAPGESASWTVEHRFPEPGRYTVTGIGTQGVLSVTVQRPNGTATVSSLTASAETTTDPVTVDVTLENTGDNPAVQTVPVTIDGTAAAERRVLVMPGEFERVSIEVAIDTAGEHTIGVGGAETTVTVASESTPTPTPTATPTPPQSGGETTAGTSTDGSDSATTTGGETGQGGADGTAGQSSADGTAGQGGTDATPTSSGSGPGFTIALAIVALAVALVARHR